MTLDGWDDTAHITYDHKCGTNCSSSPAPTPRSWARRSRQDVPRHRLGSRRRPPPLQCPLRTLRPTAVKGSDPITLAPGWSHEAGGPQRTSRSGCANRCRSGSSIRRRMRSSSYGLGSRLCRTWPKPPTHLRSLLRRPRHLGRVGRWPSPCFRPAAPADGWPTTDGPALHRRTGPRRRLRARRQSRASTLHVGAVAPPPVTCGARSVMVEYDIAIDLGTCARRAGAGLAGRRATGLHTDIRAPCGGRMPRC
jgi:hypothetical protein